MLPRRILVKWIPGSLPWFAMSIVEPHMVPLPFPRWYKVTTERVTSSTSGTVPGERFIFHATVSISLLLCDCVDNVDARISFTCGTTPPHPEKAPQNETKSNSVLSTVTKTLVKEFHECVTQRQRLTLLLDAGSAPRACDLALPPLPPPPLPLPPSSWDSAASASWWAS